MVNLLPLLLGITPALAAYHSPLQPRQLSTTTNSTLPVNITNACPQTYHLYDINYATFPDPSYRERLGLLAPQSDYARNLTELHWLDLWEESEGCVGIERFGVFFAPQEAGVGGSRPLVLTLASVFLHTIRVHLEPAGACDRDVVTLGGHSDQDVHVECGWNATVKVALCPEDRV